MHRVYDSFGNILWQFPAMTIAIMFALVVVGVTALMKRQQPPSSGALLFWILASTLGLRAYVGLRDTLRDYLRSNREARR